MTAYLIVLQEGNFVINSLVLNCWFYPIARSIPELPLGLQIISKGLTVSVLYSDLHSNDIV